MHHVTTPAPRRHDRSRAAAPLFRASPAPRRAPRLSPLNAVSLQALAGFCLPLPFIHAGHLLFGWSSVAVMWGGQ